MNTSTQKKFLPYLALLVSILGIGFSPLLTRWADAPGPVIGLYRMGGAVLILFPFYWHKRRGKPFIDREHLFFPVLAGVSNALDFSLWSVAIHTTRIANATLMNNTAPIWVALVAWYVFKEKLKAAFWLGLFLTLTGAMIILGYDFLFHPSLSLGDGIGLVSGLFYASYYLFTQRGRERISVLEFLWPTTFVSFLMQLAFSLVLGLQLSGFSTQTYIAILISSLFVQVISYFGMVYALGHIPASIVAPTMIAQPVLSAILAIPLLGETLHTAQWIGGLAVLVGIYLVNRMRTETRQEGEEVGGPVPGIG